MKRTAIIAALTALVSYQANAADFRTVPLEINVERPADEVWDKIGAFCDIQKWLTPSCSYSSGVGDVGTVRQLGSVAEVIVGKTERSYTYMMIPSEHLYHATLSVEPLNTTSSRIVYTLFYDQESIGLEAREEYRERRQKIFEGALRRMKSISESN